MFRNAVRMAWRAYRGRFMPYIHTRILRERLARFGKLLHGTALDFGAGTKPYRELFAVQNYFGANALEYYGPSAPPEIARNTDIWIDSRAPFPFRDEAFDAALCFQVLSVIQAPDDFFRELARILKPGGWLLLSTDFLYPKWAPGDVLRHTDASLRALASRNGFKVVAVESCGGWLTAVHGITMRYVRDAPQRIHDAPTAARRILRAAAYLAWIVSLPAWALFGWAAFLLERNRGDEFTFTTNLLIAARKAE